ncbi:MAG TPA: hypothetical protein VE621_20580 [Bryobacteraceae bacterium]|nr:hypothetical protein [Bryobacteraceae bacterium]
MPNGGRERAQSGPDDAYQVLQDFLRTAKAPALLEPGEQEFPLLPGNHEVLLQNGRLTLQVWDRDRNLVRKIIGVASSRTGLLELEVERFGKKIGTLKLLDTSRPQVRGATQKGSRQAFRETFRRMLMRQYPNWEIAELTTEQDLEHSFSPVYPRAMLTRGPVAWAALACPPEADADAALAFALLWFDYLRQRERKRMVEGLLLWIPEHRERNILLRARWLNTLKVRLITLVYSEDGSIVAADPQDVGNHDTHLPARSSSPQIDRAAVAEITQVPNVDAIEDLSGVHLRVNGLEFARITDDGLFATFEERTPQRASVAQLRALAEELAVRRSSESDRQSPLYTRAPEAWLESQVRRHLETIDASLLPSPVYGQVPSFSAAERGVLDLLAVHRSGRLAVLELKASEDIQLPLQALDYWMRVRWHLMNDDLRLKGFFPGVSLRSDSPVLYLVAPSLEWHPSTDKLLSYLSLEVPVVRIGLGMDWRQELQVVFRM